MKKYATSLGLIGIFAAMVACASLPGARKSLNAFSVTGVYRYADGDVIEWRCQGGSRCSDILIRDARLAKEAVALQGATLTLLVKRVDACGSESTQVACLQSDGKTALAIRAWIRVDPANHSTRQIFSAKRYFELGAGSSPAKSMATTRTATGSR